MEKYLGKMRPADTSAHILLAPNVGVKMNVTQIVVINSTAATATARIFYDPFGAAMTQENAVFYDISINPFSSLLLSPVSFPLDSSGTLSVQSGTSSALLFIANGFEEILQ